MDYENLMRSMDASADEKKEELIRKAMQSAGKMEEEAHVKAEEIVKAHALRASKALDADRNRSVFEALSEASRESADIKYEYFSRAFKAAEERLTSIREQDGYEDFFRSALMEAVEALGDGDIVLHVDARDEELCRDIVDSLGIKCAVRAGLSTAGGLNASTSDGRVTVLNNVESRLSSAKERYKLEVFSALFGD